MILKTVRLHLHRSLKGHGALSGFLSQGEVDVLICGGIGGGAQIALAEAEIKLYGGVSGDADEAVNAYLEGKLDFNPNVQCSHHAHEHSCGGHQCGENKHGCSGNQKVLQKNNNLQKYVERV